MYLLEEATAGDLPAIMRVAERALTERYDPTFFQSMLELARGTFLVARSFRDQEVVGFALATRSNTVESRLLTIALDPGLQNRGLGGRLLKELEMRMRRYGALELTLEVREDNVRAITFYRRKGYELIGKMARYYQDGSQALLMRKAL